MGMNSAFHTLPVYNSSESLKAGYSELQSVVDQVDTLVDMWVLSEQQGESFYPQSEMSNLETLPSDITEDWAEAAAWAKKLAVENGWKL